MSTIGNFLNHIREAVSFIDWARVDKFIAENVVGDRSYPDAYRLALPSRSNPTPSLENNLAVRLQQSPSGPESNSHSDSNAAALLGLSLVAYGVFTGGTGYLLLGLGAFVMGCGSEQTPTPLSVDGGSLDRSVPVQDHFPIDQSSSPDAQTVCVCGNHLPITPPQSCPPLSSSVLNQRLETILAYNSFRNVRQLIDSDCWIRPIVSQLLQNYDPCLPISDLESRFETAFRDFSLSVFCSPSLPSETRITGEFLKNLVHALYLEVNHRVPWSLNDYTPEQMEFLLPTQACIEQERSLPLVPHPDYLRYQSACGTSTADRETYKVFPLVMSAIRSNQRQTAMEVVPLVPLYFFHPSRQWPEVLYETAGDQVVACNPLPEGPFAPARTELSFLPLSAMFRERIIKMGCHGAADVAAAFLRSLNIPAVYAVARQLDETNNQFQGHGMLCLPTLNLYSHGDWLAQYPGRPGRLLLYPWDDFLRVTAGAPITVPRGVPDANFWATLEREEGNLILGAYFTVNPACERFAATMPYCSPRQGFEGDIDHPLPQVVELLRVIRQVYPESRFEVNPADPNGVPLARRPVPIQSFEELRRAACR